MTPGYAKRFDTWESFNYEGIRLFDNKPIRAFTIVGDMYEVILTSSSCNEYEDSIKNKKGTCQQVKQTTPGGFKVPSELWTKIKCLNLK